MVSHCARDGERLESYLDAKFGRLYLFSTTGEGAEKEEKVTQTETAVETIYWQS